MELTTVGGLRHSGIPLISDVPWGTHFCQFYGSGDDLLDVLVPYFKAGLENNEFCMWVTAEPVHEVDALRAMAAAVPDLQSYLDRGQLEIIPYDRWYVQDGAFDTQRVLDGWIEKLDSGLDRGYDGLRLSGNTFWLEKQHWGDFTEYEAAIDRVIGRYRMIALCTYAAAKCDVGEVADVISNHQFALVKRHGQWATIESAERRRAEAAFRESEARYRSLFENMPDGFAQHEMVFDGDGRPIDYVFAEVNEAFERLTGLRRADIIGRRVTEVLPGIAESGFDWIGAYGRVATTGEVARFEQYFEPLKRWYAVVAFSPRPGYFTAVFSDVTDRKRAEEDIRGLNQALEQRAAELEAFSYSVSHDLRAPLRAIVGFSDLLGEDLGPNLGDESRRKLRIVRKNAVHMGELIEGLLDFSRLGRAALDCRPVNMAALVGDAFAEVRGECRAGDVKLTVGAMPAARGDWILLRQVCVNLLSNAIKFSRPKGEVRIEAGGSVENGEAVYYIRDHGVGFDMHYAAKLFGVFQRLHSRDDFEGTGIGLALVQRIVQRHGGRVWAEGVENEGATFYFTLPAA